MGAIKISPSIRYPKAAFRYLEKQGFAPQFAEGDEEILKEAA